MKTYIGIDPGITGAVAWIRGDEYGVDDLPVVGGRIDAWSLHDYLTTYLNEERTVCIEKAQAMPKQGGVSQFNYGVTYGLILGAVEVAKCRIHEVAPGTWKKAMGVSKDKDAARGMAHKLFPVVRDELSRVKDHNRAEALLLAAYIRGKEGT